MLTKSSVQTGLTEIKCPKNGASAASVKTAKIQKEAVMGKIKA